MLNDFVRGKLRWEGTERIIPNIKLLLDSACKREIPIFFCNDKYLPIDTYEMKIWGAHALKGTDGAKFIDELKPHDSDYILFQRGHTALSTEQASTSLWKEQCTMAKALYANQCIQKKKRLRDSSDISYRTKCPCVSFLIPPPHFNLCLLFKS